MHDRMLRLQQLASHREDSMKNLSILRTPQSDQFAPRSMKIKFKSTGSDWGRQCGRRSKIRDLPPARVCEAVRMIRAWIYYRLIARDNISNQVTRSGSDAKAVPAESGGQYEAG